MEAAEDCCVKVAVHIRPLIGDERLQGCKDCVTVVPGKPQVKIYIQFFICILGIVVVLFLNFVEFMLFDCVYLC